MANWRDHYFHPPRSFTICTNVSPPEIVVFSREVLEREAAAAGVDLSPLCLGDVDGGEWTRSGWERRWSFTGRVGGEDKRGVLLSFEADAALNRVVVWRERPTDPEGGAARVLAIRAAMEDLSPGSTSDVESDAFAAFEYRRRGIRYTVSARLTDEAMRAREADHSTEIVLHDEAPEETALRLLGVTPS